MNRKLACLFNENSIVYPGEIFRDTVLKFASAKLVWISKGSHKSRRDLRAIMRRISSADRELVIGFAQRNSLLDLLESVLAESDELIEP